MIFRLCDRAVSVTSEGPLSRTFAALWSAEIAADHPPDLHVNEAPGGYLLGGAAPPLPTLHALLGREPEGWPAPERRADGVWVSDRVPPRLVADLLTAWLMTLQPHLLFAHGATLALGPLRRGLFLTGPSGAGKTTLSLALAARGHDLLGDDIAAIEEAGEAAPILRPVRRTPLTRPVAPRPFWDPEHQAPRVYHPLQPASPAPAALAHAIFLLGPASQTRATPMTPSLSDPAPLAALGQCNTVASAWGSDPARWLFKIARLATALGRVPCTALELGDLDESVAVIEGLML